MYKKIKAPSSRPARSIRPTALIAEGVITQGEVDG
jgi:hypothetical protein